MKLSELMQDRELTNRHEVPVLLSTDAAMRLSRASAAVEQAKLKLDRARRAENGKMAAPLTVEAKEELDQAEAEKLAAEEAAEEHLIDFVFESLGSDAWEDLIDAYPSPQDQVERLGENDPGYDTRQFPIAAVAACLKEPQVDGIDDVKKLKSKVPDIVWQQLFAAVLRANRGPNAVPPSLTGSRGTRASGVGSELPSS